MRRCLLIHIDHPCFNHALFKQQTRPVTKKRLRLDDQLCFALYAATNAVTRAYKPKLAQVGITYPQYLVLLVLWQNGTCTIKQIADRLQLPANGITPVLDRLERADFLERRRDTHDRRLVHIHLTAAGAALERDVANAQKAVVCETQLEADELDALREQLRALAMRMGMSETVSEDDR